MESVQRNWGWYHVLYEGDDYRVKLLQIDPHNALSNQYHQHRSESWHCVKGQVTINLFHPDKDKQMYTVVLNPGDTYNIEVGTWHKAMNHRDEVCEVVEVWSGDKLTEEDIVRSG